MKEDGNRSGRRRSCVRLFCLVAFFADPPDARNVMKQYLQTLLQKPAHARAWIQDAAARRHAPLGLNAAVGVR
jgi:hypothetical protein